MKALQEIYPERFFCRRHRMNWRAPVLVGAMREEFGPASVLDVGCATGDLVAEWLAQGVDAYGLEGSPAALPYIEVDRDRMMVHDLRAPLHVRERVDLVTCFEVAEHIEPEHAGQFVANLAAAGDRLLVSCAPPGQGGHYHVNCQPAAYWDALFGAIGYRRARASVVRLRAAWAPWAGKPGIKAIWQNLAYFERAA